MSAIQVFPDAEKRLERLLEALLKLCNEADTNAARFYGSDSLIDTEKVRFLLKTSL